jgi:phosphoadenosine phosphosulfate reductase
VEQQATSNNAAPAWDLTALNETFSAATPQTIVRWALSHRLPTITTTGFGVQSAATLHLVSTLDPEAVIVWLDTGFTEPATRAFAKSLCRQLSLNLLTYRPRHRPVTLLSQLGISEVVGLSEPQRQALARRVKLEPFERAVRQLQPRIWISGIRAEETAFRSGLGIASWDPRGILKLAPFLNYSATEMDAYLAQHGLPAGPEAVDPTKAAPHLECGLHTRQGS